MKTSKKNPNAPFQTISGASHITGLSQSYLRKGAIAGTIPHIKSGNTYMINIPLLMETMDKLSAQPPKPPLSL